MESWIRRNVLPYHGVNHSIPLPAQQIADMYEGLLSSTRRSHSVKKICLIMSNTRRYVFYPMDAKKQPLIYWRGTGVDIWAVEGGGVVTDEQTVLPLLANAKSQFNTRSFSGFLGQLRAAKRISSSASFLEQRHFSRRKLFWVSFIRSFNDTFHTFGAAGWNRTAVYVIARLERKSRLIL